MGYLDDIGRILPVEWYLTNLPRMLVWPVIAFGVLGLFQAVKRASWQSTMLLFAFSLFGDALNDAMRSR